MVKEQGSLGALCNLLQQREYQEVGEYFGTGSSERNLQHTQSLLKTQIKHIKNNHTVLINSYKVEVSVHLFKAVIAGEMNNF